MRPLWRNLSLIAGAGAGAGETLVTANPNWSMKRRLLRHLAAVDADVVIADVGAGTGIHELDFFNAGDIRIVVTVPQPTASVDANRFIKLATIRESGTTVPTRNLTRRSIERTDFETAAELWRTVDVAAPDRRSPAGKRRVSPWVIVNQSNGSRRAYERLQAVSERFQGHELRLLGEIPSDPEVAASIAKFLPVFEQAPNSPAAAAFQEIARKLDDELTRMSIAKRATTRTFSGGTKPASPEAVTLRQRERSAPSERFTPRSRCP